MEERKFSVENVDMSFIISTLWKNKGSVIKAAILGLIFGLIVAVSLPKTYEANMSFAPETEQKLGSGMSSIASMMGVTLNNSVDAISVEMFPDLVASSSFISQLFDVQVESMDGRIKTTVFDYINDYQKHPWWSMALGLPFRLLGMLSSGDGSSQSDTLSISNFTKEQRAVINYFRNNLKVDQDNKSGKTVVSLTMQDPLIAATVLDVAVNNLKDYVSSYRTSKSREDVKNLTLICQERKDDYYRAQEAYANFADSNRNLVRLNAQAEQLRLQQEMQLAYQVYSQVATQLEGARINEQQAKPVFVVLEPVTIPLKKFPSKFKMMLGFMAIFAFASLFWILLGKKYYNLLLSNIQ